MNAKKLSKLILSVVGIAAGAAAIVFGVVTIKSSPGYVWPIQQDVADVYSYLANFTIAATDNIAIQTLALTKAIGWLMIAGGAALVVAFAMRLIDQLPEKTAKKEPELSDEEIEAILNPEPAPTEASAPAELTDGKPEIIYYDEEK